MGTRTGPTRSDVIFTGASEDEDVLLLRDFVWTLRRRMWIVVLVAVVLGGLVVGFDLQRTPTYEASIKILIGQERQEPEPGSLGGDVMGLRDITQTMVKAVDTLPVAEAVVRQLDLRESPEELLSSLSSEQIELTQFVEVSYQGSSPEEAQKIVNAVGDVFVEKVSEVNPTGNRIIATVWEEAAMPDSPVSPKPVRDGLLALVLGSMLGIGLAFLLEVFDDRWRSPAEVEQIAGVPIFGVIPEFETPKPMERGEAS